MAAELRRDLGFADASTALMDRKHGPSSGAGAGFSLGRGFATYSDRFMPRGVLAKV